MQTVKWSVGTQMSLCLPIAVGTPRGIALWNSTGLMQTPHRTVCTSRRHYVAGCWNMKTNRQCTRQVMTLTASALLGLRKHSLQAADKSTIVDSGSASPEIGMTYFIMWLTSHGKMLFLFIRAKIKFLHVI